MPFGPPRCRRAAGAVKLALALCLGAGLAQAQESIRSDGRLSDDNFYRLVSCAAPESGACQKDVVRWSPADARDISIGIVRVANDYPAALRNLADAALNGAIDEVNAADANLHLTRSDTIIKPDIAVFLLAIKKGDEIAGTGLDPLDGAKIEAAKVQIWWRADRTLIKGAIVLANDVLPDEIRSIMLEEVTQTMGLLTDVDSDYYETRSIFSETSNQRSRLGAQDIMVLQRHYP